MDHALDHISRVRVELSRVIQRDPHPVQSLDASTIRVAERLVLVAHAGISGIRDEVMLLEFHHSLRYQDDPTRHAMRPQVGEGLVD